MQLYFCTVLELSGLQWALGGQNQADGSPAFFGCSGRSRFLSSSSFCRRPVFFQLWSLLLSRKHSSDLSNAAAVTPLFWLWPSCLPFIRSLRVHLPCLDKPPFSPHFRILKLVTLAKFLLSCEVTFSLVLKVKIRTSLGLFFCLPDRLLGKEPAGWLGRQYRNGLPWGHSLWLRRCNILDRTYKINVCAREGRGGLVHWNKEKCQWRHFRKLISWVKGGPQYSMAGLACCFRKNRLHPLLQWSKPCLAFHIYKSTRLTKVASNFYSVSVPQESSIFVNS